jgi:hypothetical protein
MYTIFVGEGIAYFVGCIGKSPVNSRAHFFAHEVYLVLNALDSAFSSGKPDLFPYVDLSQM